MDSTLTVVVLIYASAFEYLKMGYGAALSVMLFPIIGVVTIFDSRLLRYNVSY